ncbi:MAG TPA: cytochrome c oxidase assembly protein [Trebonia sp.]|nr:cytochrome c oxidase assembly protein [Trebonia sp.]
MALLASGYVGPPELTLGSALTQWTADLPVIAFVVVLGGCYLAAVRKVRRSGRSWETGRGVAFCALGLGVLVIATMSWTGVYQNVLFYARATQTVLLVLLVPLFLAMGKPLTLLGAAFPAAGRRTEAVVRSRAAVVLTFPAITTLALVAVPMTMYFTSWYTAAFHSDAIRELTYLVLMIPGYVFFWTLLRVDPVPRLYPYGVAMWITAAEVVGDAFFGIAIIADTNLIAGPYYHAVGYPWGPGLSASQVIGGGIIWILGDLVGLPFLAVQLIQMMREDQAEAAVIDAELDARDAARASAATAAAGDGDGDRDRESGTAASVPADDDRPWWETDPRITERFGKG